MIPSSGHMHVFPVDKSLTPLEAWVELCCFGKRVTYTGDETWSVVQCGGEECWLIEWELVPDCPSEFNVVPKRSRFSRLRRLRGSSNGEEEV